MVSMRSSWCGLLPALLILPAVSAQAQGAAPPSNPPPVTVGAQVLPATTATGVAQKVGGILEALQDEVSAIAMRTKSAVVTIEDSRAIAVSERTYETSPLLQHDIENKISHLVIDKQAQDAKVSQLEAQNRAGAVDRLTLDEAKHQQQRLDFEIAAQQRLLSELGHVSRQDLFKRELEDRIGLLDIDGNALDNRIALLEKQVEAGGLDKPALDNAHREREHVARDLQETRKRLDEFKGGANSQAPSNYAPGEALWYFGTDPNNQTYPAYIAWQSAPKSGTGFSIGDGYIVTTADVLQGMNSPVVVTDGGLTVRARTVGIDTERNVGLVKLDSNVAIASLTLGDSSKVAPGHFAISIGNQAGQTNAIALNIISGVRKEGTYSGTHFYPTLIEIGGTVGAGTSGAPLVNARGEVIGVLAGVPVASVSDYIYSAPEMPRNAAPDPFGKPGPAQKEPGIRTDKFVPPVPPRTKDGDHSPAPGKGDTSAEGAGPGAEAAPDDVVPSPGAPDGKTEAGSETTLSTANSLFRAGVKPLQGQPNVPDSTGTAVLPYGNYNNFFSGAQADEAVNQYNRLLTRFDRVGPEGPAVTSAGFAIPINELKPVIEQLRSGKPQKSIWIGIATKEEEHVSETKGIIQVEYTVKVNGVYPDSPAYRAGVQPGDILISLDKKSIHNAADVHDVVLHLQVGDTLQVELKHNGAPKALSFTIEPRPASLKPPITEPIKESL